MAITINGSGSITGISAGGLPDGSVTNADLANSTVTVNGTSIALGGSENITAGRCCKQLALTQQQLEHQQQHHGLIVVFQRRLLLQVLVVKS